MIGFPTMTNSVIENIRCSLERKELGLLGQRPAIYPSRQPGTKSEEIDRFLDEINKISGVAQKLERENILCALESLVSANGVRKATVWQTARFEQLGIENILNHLGVDVIPSTAEKHQIALCDLGITEADFLLPETGTLVLKLHHCYQRFILRLSTQGCFEPTCIKSLVKYQFLQIIWSSSPVLVARRILNLQSL